MNHRQLTDNNQDKQAFLDALAAELPPFIARTEISSLLGGIVTGKTLSNADAKGEGPEVTYAIGRKIVYSREALINWLATHFAIQRLEGNIRNV